MCGRQATVGGDHAEVAPTHSRCTWDGLHLGSSMVCRGPRAALGVWLQCRRPVPSHLRCTRLGVLGFTAGVTFSGLLVLTEGRRRFDQMSLSRFAGWGATGGLLVSALFANAASLGWGDVLAVAPTLALTCAVCASGSLAVARRAVRRELPDIRGDTAEAELTVHEKRKLL